MMRIPMRFERIAAAFGELPRAGDEGEVEESSANLSALVNSFLEREMRNGDDRDGDLSGVLGDDEMESNSESRELLKSLFAGENDAVRRKIHVEVENACREISGGKSASSEFKRRLVAWLRSRGFDAGLCKSKCEKNGRRPFGDYEYVDVNAAGNRYMIEVHFAGEFTIARPTGGYADLLELFPPIFVAKPDELRQVVRLMCNAVRKSMKTVGMPVPPWRRLAYMQSKWFGSFKRTTSEVAGGGDSPVNRRPPAMGTSFYCRDAFAPETGVRTGNRSKMLL